LKIYTRSGDAGETGLFGGRRVPKDHPRVVAYGTLDELNAFLGRARLHLRVETTRDRLGRIQHELFSIGSHLATPPTGGGRPRPSLPELPLESIAWLEGWIDEVEGELSPLRNFILPGGSAGAAELHICRTVCRRGERLLLPLAHEEDPSVEFALCYLNRLSDLLFVLARLENQVSGEADTPWVQGPR